jgi:uncharacterized membrane protein YcaP (DUF421 family)
LAGALQTQQTDPATIEVAYLERNGKISAIPYPHEPRVFNVSIQQGVRTVRIEL